ncbi:hypothetical protein GCM10023080_017850 [Streptomyces pseudoechinosporeus]
MENAIELRELTKTYGTRRGLTGLTLDVRAGEVFGFLGPNGAGKSTTIRLLLDLIRPTSGRAAVLGLDPRRDGVALRSRVGYLAGDFVCDGRQNVRGYLRFLAALRGGVPQERIDALADRLGLDQTARIKKLSKGNRQKVGLVQAFMHTPELLILDEPTSGLDPLAQQTFLDLVAEAAGNGQSVFMSSHIGTFSASTPTRTSSSGSATISPMRRSPTAPTPRRCASSACTSSAAPWSASAPTSRPAS